MEQITVCSKNDLSELTDMINCSVPVKSFETEQGVNEINFFTADKKYFHKISDYIAVWINKRLGFKKVIEFLNSKYEILTNDERLEISRDAIQKLKEENQYLVRMISEKLVVLFEISNYINIEGFINFCLKEYSEELEIIVDECLDEYLTKKDYREFLNLLHYFSEIEESNFGNLYVVTQQNGGYKFYDENKREITDECINIFKREFMDTSVNQDDLLISILILLLPEQIIFYGTDYIKNKKFLKTLQIVFEKRIIFYQDSNIFTYK